MIFPITQSLLFVTIVASTFNTQPSDDLFKAVTDGDLTTTRILISQNNDFLRTTDDIGRTPLHVAAESGHLEIAKYLIKNGADVNAVDVDKNTTLHRAMSGKNTELIKLLLDSGVSINALNGRQRNALTAGMFPNAYNFENCMLLIERGVDINNRDQNNGYALQMAAIDGYNDIAKELLKRGAEIPTDDSQLNRLAYFSALGGCASVFDATLKLGVTIEPTNDDGGNFFRAAASGGSAEIGETLIKSGVDPDWTNFTDVAAIHFAAEYGYEEFIEMLVKSGADINLRNAAGKTAYNIAGDNGHKSVQKLLKQSNCDTSPQQFPVLTSKYFEPELPDENLHYFSLGIVSVAGARQSIHSTPTFSPEMDEMFWTKEFKGPIMHTKKVNGQWTAPVIASFVSIAGDGEPIFSHDGNKVFFLSERQIPGQPDSHKENIWFVVREGDDWSEPKPVSQKVNQYMTHWQFCLDANDALYLASAREGSKGRDIYRSDFVDGEYTDPVPLAAEINSEYDDSMPFIAHDGSYMLFVRWRIPSKLVATIFISYKNEDGSWEEAIEVGEPINSRFQVICPMVTPDGKYVLLLSGSYVLWTTVDVLPKREQK